MKQLGLQISRRTILDRAILFLPVLRFVVGALVPMPVSAPTPIELYDKVLEFEKHWDIFVRNLFGCQKTGETNSDTCKPSNGSINYSEWTRARNAAKKLFELEDKF